MMAALGHALLLSRAQASVDVVDVVDARDKSHRTTQRGDNGPAGMDRGPRGPHESCATFRKQRVDMQSMWRQGSLRMTRTPLYWRSAEEFLSVECAPCDNL